MGGHAPDAFLKSLAVNTVFIKYLFRSYSLSLVLNEIKHQ
jgi:hypothetical protein